MKYKVINKTFQPFQLMYNNDVLLLNPRTNENYAFVKEVTTQMKRLEKKGLIKIKTLK